MSIENDIYELIERYLNGELSETEKIAVEQKIAFDPEFSSEVEFHKMTALVVKGADQDRMREKVKEDIDKFDKQNKSRSFKTWIGLGILLLIAGLSSLFFFKDRPKEEKSAPINTDMQWHNAPGLQTSQSSVKDEIALPNISNAKSATPSTPTISPSSKEEKAIAQKEYSIPEAKVETVIPVKKEEIRYIEPAKSETTKIENHPVEKASFDCSSTHIEVSPKITATCEHASNGIINFEGAAFVGGKSPYQITLHKKNKHISNTLFY